MFIDVKLFIHMNREKKTKMQIVPSNDKGLCTYVISGQIQNAYGI